MRREGLYTGGEVPYGYSRAEPLSASEPSSGGPSARPSLVPNLEEQAILARIREVRSNGATLRRIRAELGAIARGTTRDRT